MGIGRTDADVAIVGVDLDQTGQPPLHRTGRRLERLGRVILEIEVQRLDVFDLHKDALPLNPGRRSRRKPHMTHKSYLSQRRTVQEAI